MSTFPDDNVTIRALSGRACYSFNEDRTHDLGLIFIAFDTQKKNPV